MKRVAMGLLKLYPNAWQVRYGEEMTDILDHHGATWRTVIDLVVGAVKAHLFWERKGIWRMQFLVGSALLTFFCLFSYTLIQQYLRQNANFPQQTMVQKIVTNLESGYEIQTQIPQDSVDVRSNLAPFVIVYNNEGTVMGSNVHANGQTPVLPQGVIDYTRVKGIDKLTWQPKSDIRIATVIEHYDGNGGGFVLSGRSLRIVEDEETAWLRFFEWMWAALIGGFIVFLFKYRRRRRFSM